MQERFRRARLALGISSQRELGKKLGCSRDKIANVELGRVVPDNLFISHFCHELDISETWLRTGEGDMLETSDDMAELFLNRFRKLSPREFEFLSKFLLMPERDREEGIAFLEKLFSVDPVDGISKDRG